MDSIKYKRRDGLFISFSPDTKEQMSYSKLKSTYEDKVVSIDDLAKVLGIAKPKPKAKKEEK